MQSADIKEPLLSPDIKYQRHLMLKIYEYDIQTVAGGIYTISRAE